MCNGKEATHSDKATENYHQLCNSTELFKPLLAPAGSCFQKTSLDKPYVHRLPRAKSLISWLVQKVEHLTTKELSIFLRSWWRLNQI